MPGHHPLLRGPEAIAKQVRQLAAITRTPIFLVGDLRDGGGTYAHDVIDALARTPVSNRIVFEFFDPPDAELVARIDASIRSWGAELSPESYDESIRGLLGKARFTNERMMQAIESVMASRCESLDLFFMIGLPGQTTASVTETVDAIEELFVRFDHRLSTFITPMAPFVDPGSDGFADAEAYGYRLRARTLAEHRALLETSDWESMLNYETDWMTRREIVEATYNAAERLNDLKRRYGRISGQRAGRVEARRSAAHRLGRRNSCGVGRNAERQSRAVRAGRPSSQLSHRRNPAAAVRSGVNRASRSKSRRVVPSHVPGPDETARREHSP
jgi:radical SAM superfamily enzyme YgiQ (UPF0313 family)